MSPDSPRPKSGHSAVFASLEVDQYRWLFVSNTAFFLAMGGMRVLRSWLVFELTDSEFALGLISAVVAAPMLVIAPFGGAIADRIDRRTLVAIGQAIVVLGQTVVLVLLLTDRLEFWHLLALAALMGTAFPFIMPARQAIVANVVGRERLSNAMALNMASVNTTRIVGPAVAGFLIGTVGLKVAYALHVLLYFLGLAALWRLDPAPPPPESFQTSMRHNLREGFAYVLEDRLVLVLLFFGLVPMSLAMPFQNLLVVFTEDVWSVGPEGLGVMSAVAGVGGLIGAIAVARHALAKGRLRAMMTAAVGFGTSLLLFSFSPWYSLALPLVLLADAFASYYSALNNTAIQVLIPDAVRGRVSSFLMMSFSLPLLGTLPVGAAAEVWGAPAAVGTASLLAVLIAFAFYGASKSLHTMDSRLHASMHG